MSPIFAVLLILSIFPISYYIGNKILDTFDSYLTERIINSGLGFLVIMLIFFISILLTGLYQFLTLLKI